MAAKEVTEHTEDVVVDPADTRPFPEPLDPSETRYFRQDNVFNTVETALNAIRYTNKSGATLAGSVYANVYVNYGAGSTQIGTSVATVTRTANGSGYQTNTWACPQTSLNAGDKIVVMVVVNITGTLNSTNITSEVLGGQSLDASTWTFNYFTNLNTNATRANMRLYYGNSPCQSRVLNFNWTKAPTSVAVTDAFGLTDASTRPLRSFVRTDGFGFTDTAARPLRSGILVQDSFGISENLTLVKLILKQITDSLGLVDSASRPLKSVALSDHFGLGDATIVAKLKMVVDSLGITEAVSLYALIVKTVTDSLGLTDTASRVVRNMVIEDDLGFSELILLPLRHLVAADSLGLTDSVCLIKLQQVLDSLGLSEFADIIIASAVRYITLQRIRYQTGLLTEDDITDADLRLAASEAEATVEGWAKRDGIKTESWLPTIPPLVIHTITLKASEIALARKQYDGRLAASESRSGSSMSLAGKGGVEYFHNEAEKMWHDYLVAAGTGTQSSRQFGVPPLTSHLHEDEWRQIRRKRKAS